MSTQLRLTDSGPVLAMLKRRGKAKLVAVAHARAKSTDLADLMAAYDEVELIYSAKQQARGS